MMVALNGKVDSNGNFSIAIPSDYVLTGKETIKITSIDKEITYQLSQYL